jgi:membrane-bound ClpP family serine protease
VELTATASYFMLLGGVLVACVEFLRPGLVVPGVAGGVAATWGLSRLASDGLYWRAVCLFVLGLALLALESWSWNKSQTRWRHWGRWVGAFGGYAMWWGSVHLVESPFQIDAWSAGVGVALFYIITVPMLSAAIQARQNKTTFQ